MPYERGVVGIFEERPTYPWLMEMAGGSSICVEERRLSSKGICRGEMGGCGSRDMLEKKGCRPVRSAS